MNCVDIVSQFKTNILQLEFIKITFFLQMDWEVKGHVGVMGQRCLRIGWLISLAMC